MNAVLKSTSLVAAAILALALALSPATRANTESAPETGLSRTQVLAELALWRESGMEQAQAGERASDPEHPDYIAALARYNQLRAGPRFAQHVERIARERGEKVVVSSGR